jgi:uncharacterized protein (TIGR03435 family)
MTRILAGLLIASTLVRQATNLPPAPPTAYSVASIRPNKSSDDRFMLRPLPGGLNATGVTLVAKNGPKLKPNPDDPTQVKPSAMLGGGSGTFTNSSMAVLAGRLSTQLGRPVIDRTDLKGGCDFTLEWTPAPGEGTAESIGLPPRAEPAPPGDSIGPSIFTALQDQLGLKLESTKGQAEILLIDRVERPSEN